jgi:hypothetical protein
MSRFFTEISSSNTNHPPKSKAAYDAIGSDFKKIFFGFFAVDYSGFNGIEDHPDADIRFAFGLYFNTPFIEALKQTLAPMLVSHDQTNEINILLLNTRQLPDEHPLWTHQGRMDIYSEFMSNLITATIEEIKNHKIPDEEQTFLERLSREMPHFTEEKILELLSNYFKVFKKDFDASSKFEKKYQILETLVQLSIPLSYYGHFRAFISHREQCRLNWLFNQSPLSSLLPEITEEIKSHLISPENIISSVQGV